MFYVCQQSYNFNIQRLNLTICQISVFADGKFAKIKKWNQVLDKMLI